MDQEFSLLGGGPGNSRVSFLNIPLAMPVSNSSASTASSSSSSSMLPAPYYSAVLLPQAAAVQQQRQQAGPSAYHKQLDADHHVGGHGGAPRGAELPQSEVDAIKAKIMSHPQYTALLAAYLDCQKVGAPPEVVEHLMSMTSKLEARPIGQQHNRMAQDLHCDPELDQFMEAYCNMLVKYKEELARPIQEAMDFLRRVETQLTSLTDGGSGGASTRFLISEGKGEGFCSSEEDMDGNGQDCDISGIDPRAEDKELKYQLLKKYSGCLSSLRQEFSKKKKKGKLPKEARQKLLSWWDMHYKWPYPSETEKIALAESTGLDQKQINNWFINQRKRHWKPSEDMPFVMMDGFHPQGASLYMSGQYMADGLYRLGS